MEKYHGAGQAAYDNMAHALWMQDTSGYKHTLRICNTYCFCTTTMVARTRLIVRLYLHFPFCQIHKMEKRAFLLR